MEITNTVYLVQLSRSTHRVFQLRVNHTLCCLPKHHLHYSLQLNVEKDHLLWVVAVALQGLQDQREWGISWQVWEGII